MIGRLLRPADRRAADPPPGPSQRVITNSSIATGRPLPMTLIFNVWLPTRLNDLLKIVTCGLNELRRRSTTATTLPSIETWALPRVGPTGPIQATDLA
jgi:hypothetical protein